MADADAQPQPTETAMDADIDAGPSDIDEVWTSSRTARQIYSLGLVEKDISRLLSLAASSISLLALPQTDAPDDNLPQDGHRTEMFVSEATEYFERLDRIQENLRASLAHIRQSRISPRAIVAPQPGQVPPTLGVGLVADEGTAEGGLQEARVARDAWRNVRDALLRLKTGEAGEKPEEELKEVEMKDDEESK